MEGKLNSYSLSRHWFNFCFDNPEKIKPTHSALYFFCIEHCNRLGWKKKFGLPTTMVKEAIGIRSYNTYINTLNDLIEFGFITLIEKSKNQYSSNIIALSNFNKATDSALDKALIKHDTKQGQSTDTIDKPIKQKTIKQTIDLFWDSYHSISKKPKTDLEASKKHWEKLTEDEKDKAIKNIKSYIDSVNDSKYIIKARTYLSDKRFNDEFAPAKKKNIVILGGREYDLGSGETYQA